MPDVPESVLPLFVAAGWRPGRCVNVPSAVPVSHPAFAVLSEFGGLTIGQVGLDEKIAFRELDLYEKITKVWEGLLGSQLIGIAEVHNAHGELYMDATGRYFGASYIHDAFYFEGSSFSEAIPKLILGGRAQPMLRPDRDHV
ncbi:MAG: hypothetical protein DMG94_01020, partial [Acidobacteria bacterium]